MDHISRFKREPEEGQGNGIFLASGAVIQVLMDKMKQDKDWVTISSLCDPNLLLKLIERSTLKQSDNHNNTGVLVVAEQQSTTQLCQEDQVSKTAHYNQPTTRVELARVF